MYQYIFENAPIGIVYFDESGIITEVNNKFIEILGSERGKIIGFNLNDVKNEYLRSAIKKAFNGEIGIYEGEYTTITSGITIPIYFEVHPVQKMEGDRIRGIGMVQDISDRYYTTKKLKESEEKYRMVFENNHNIMFLIDTQTGYIKDVNPAAVKFYGWSYDELTSMKISEINTLSAKEIKKEIEKVKNANQNLFQFKHRLASGKVRDVEVLSGLVHLDGQLLLYSIVHDITDKINRQKELKKFKLGIERSSNVIFITDKEGEIEYINPSFTEQYEYKPEEVIGKTPRILKSGEQDPEFYDQFWETIKSGSIMKGELVNKTKSGKSIDVKFSSNPIISEDGEIIGYLAIQENITEQKERDRALKHSLKEKEIMLQEIHHRVKNNLAMISALLELNLYQDKEISVDELVNNTLRRIKAMASVHELLYQFDSFSKISFKAYIHKLVDSIQRTVCDNDHVKIDIKTEIEDVELNVNQAIPVGVILSEWISNAIQHAFKGRKKGTVIISLNMQNEEIQLKVEDDGIGFTDNENILKATSLGIILIRTLAQQLSAKVTMDNTESGLRCELKFNRKDNIRGSSGNYYHKT